MSISTIDVDEATRLGFATHAALSRRDLGATDISTMPPHAKLDLLRQSLERLEQVNLLTNEQSKEILHFATTGERSTTHYVALPANGAWTVAGVFGVAMAHTPAEHAFDGDDPTKQGPGVVEFIVTVAEAVALGYAIAGPLGGLIGGLLAIFG